MKQNKLKFKYLVLLSLVFFASSSITNCGGGSVDLGSGSDVVFDEPGSGDSNTAEVEDTGDECSDTGEAMTTGDISVEVSGTACLAPSPSSTETGVLILGCNSPTARTASDAAVDYVTVTCDTGSSEDSVVYFCSAGAVFRDNGETSLEISETATVECTVDGEGAATLTEDGLVIS